MLKTERLRNIFNKYLELNDLTISFASRCCKIPWTTISCWANGQRELSDKNIRKIENFLKGNFLISVDDIIKNLDTDTAAGHMLY